MRSLLERYKALIVVSKSLLIALTKIFFFLIVNLEYSRSRIIDKPSLYILSLSRIFEFRIRTLAAFDDDWIFDITRIIIDAETRYMSNGLR